MCRVRTGNARGALLVSTLLLLVALLGGCSMIGRVRELGSQGSPTISRQRFGTTKSGTSVDEYHLSSGRGVSASIITYGGIIRAISVPDRHGNSADIVLGFDSLAQYETRHPYFGTITGRYANRIARGSFELDGTRHTLATNNPPNHLHGGHEGFDRAVWSARTESRADSVALVLSHLSPDGDQGYPGAVAVEVTYTVSALNTLRIDYVATSDKATPINLTSHSYFNLAGHDSGDVLRQKVQIFADQYVPVDATLIPTGALLPVAGTAFDFRQPRMIGARISEVAPGYDHTFVLQELAGLKRAAVAWDPGSGRALEVVTSEPGVQFYTGNFLDGSQAGKGGALYQRYAGFCLETQHFPDSVNQPSFPSTILRPGDVYRQSTLLKFGIHDYDS